jgi:hypothetical protein
MARAFSMFPLKNYPKLGKMMKIGPAKLLGQLSNETFSESEDPHLANGW